MLSSYRSQPLSISITIKYTDSTESMNVFITIKRSMVLKYLNYDKKPD